MFISALIEVAKDGALIGLVTHDSFLTARMHRNLRERILQNCSIHYISLCPTDLFWNQKADVRTCLLILQKGKQYQREVRLSKRPLNTFEFQKILEDRLFNKTDIAQMVLSGEKDNNEFTVGCPNEIKQLFNYPRLGDFFRCVTGISTGNDSKYLSKEINGYFTVPFYKNPGSRRFKMEPDGFLPKDFLNIEKLVSNFMVRNKDILFKEGISCSSMGIPFGACYLPSGATFGVNANIICEREDIGWLLSYLNSSLVTYFVRGVLIRTNMITSGYVSRIPIIPLTQIQKRALASIAEKALASKTINGKARYLIKEVDEILYQELNFSAETLNETTMFCENLLRYT
jgi:hypothetical protein